MRRCVKTIVTESFMNFVMERVAILLLPISVLAELMCQVSMLSSTSISVSNKFSLSWKLFSSLCVCLIHSLIICLIAFSVLVELMYPVSMSSSTSISVSNIRTLFLLTVSHYLSLPFIALVLFLLSFLVLFLCLLSWFFLERDCFLWKQKYPETSQHINYKHRSLKWLQLCKEARHFRWLKLFQADPHALFSSTLSIAWFSERSLRAWICLNYLLAR